MSWPSASSAGFGTTGTAWRRRRRREGKPQLPPPTSVARTHPLPAQSEYEEVAEQEAAAQAVPKAQDGPIPEERKQSAVRMTGVRVERVREGVGRMLYEDGELYEGALASC